MSRTTTSSLVFGLLLVAGCGASNPPAVSEGHLMFDKSPADNIPEPVARVPVLPKPQKRPDLETYTVVVNDVPVRELLFSMARDARLNLDIGSDIEANVTMNAIDQTLPKILDRIARQANIRYQLLDDTLRVQADKPFLKTYSISYLNISRRSAGTVEVSSEIRSTGTGNIQGGQGGASSGKSGNDSSSVVQNTSNNHFWKTLAINIAAMIGQPVKASDQDNVQTGDNIIVNKESGMIAVKATAKQHAQIQAFIDKVLDSVQRQVLIEATIAEVKLSDRYQAGIDWSLVTSDPNTTTTQDLLGGNLGSTPFFSFNIAETVDGNPLNVTLKALETFGDVKVLSSPKVMAINNQSALLKVVDNEVYFTTNVEAVPGSVNQNAFVTIDTDVNTVPVGFVMAVTPFIDSNDFVTLNVRPTISRIIDFVTDPNPALAEAGVTSEIPVIQVREIESVLKIGNGDTAVIGGLMQDQIDKSTTGVPILSSIPLLGTLFSYQDDTYVKSELVIFIRPVVTRDASLAGDFKAYRKYLLEELHSDNTEQLESAQKQYTNSAEASH
ncbi:MAG: pilus (MSHA type) biogenesis protein MshL [Gammaproteobacteria bacterium]|nr:pilus (MSHA type) biogenesis protein MshL [Gammaproteobacteria bacterium]